MIEFTITKPVKLAAGTVVVQITTKIELIPIEALNGELAVIYLN